MKFLHKLPEDTSPEQLIFLKKNTPSPSVRIHRTHPAFDPLSVTMGTLCQCRHRRFLYLQQSFPDRPLLLGNDSGSKYLSSYRDHAL